MNTALAIQTEGLGRIYKIRGGKRDKKALKELIALKDVYLEVEQGELFGLLGPNGAGKTTLIKILTTLLGPSSGWARVLGLDVAKEPRQVRPLINMVSGGESSGYGLLTVRENLWMFAQFYGVPSKEAYRRIDMMLEAVGLADRANTKSSDLSTGLRQKMNIVRGFVTEPRVLFLDEPTLGLDVNASRDVRSFVRNWLAEQPDRTLLLTTHYMAEADELCDRVAIINKGQVLACDTPAALKLGLQRDSLFEVQTTPLDGLPVSVLEKLDGVRSVTHTAEDGRSTLNFRLREEAALAGVITTLSGARADILKLTKHEPTLEDVFVELVGSSIEDAEKEEEQEAESEESTNPA